MVICNSDHYVFMQSYILIITNKVVDFNTDCWFVYTADSYYDCH